MEKRKHEFKFICAILTGLMVLVISITIFRLWGTDLNVPISGYRSDSVGMLTATKNYLINGEIQGAIRDYLLIIPVNALLARIFGSVEAGINVHAILSYVILALSVYFVCYKLGISKIMSMISAVAYVFMTYFVFTCNTLLLAYVVCFYLPSFAYCVICLMEEKSNNYTIKSVAFLIVTMFCVGIYSAYYAFFALLIWAFASVYSFFRFKSVEKFFVSVIGFVTIAYGIVVYTMPSVLNKVGLGTLVSSSWYYLLCVLIAVLFIILGVLFWKTLYHRVTIKVIYVCIALLAALAGITYIFLARFTDYIGQFGGRTLYAVELGALNISSVILPAVNNIFGLNEQIGLFVDLENCDVTPQGILQGIGFIYSIANIFQFKKPANDRKDDILKICGMCNAFMAIVAVKGGFASIIAAVVTTGIRNYNRMEVYIALFSLISFSILIDKVFEKIRSMDKMWLRRCAGGALCVAVVFAILCSIPTYFIYGDSFGLVGYDQRKQEHDEWYGLIGEIEDSVPESSKILILPTAVDDTYFGELMDAGRAYELSIPSIVAESTTWSTSIGWNVNETAIEDSPEQFLQAVLDAGYAGIYIDALMYNDKSYENQIEALEQYLGEPIVCASQRRYFFNMSNYERTQG